MAALRVVRRWGVPLATAASVPLLVPAVVADSGDKDSPAPPTSRMVRPSDLPIYEEPEEVLDFEYHGREKTSLEEGAGVVRKEVEKVLEATRSARERITHIYETGKAHSMATIDYLADEENVLPRAGAITVGGLAGLVVGARRKGGFFKKVLYTSTGVITAASLCYPRHAYLISQKAYGTVKDYGAIGYNFLVGVKPQSKIPTPPELAKKETVTEEAPTPAPVQDTTPPPIPALEPEGAEVRSTIAHLLPPPDKSSSPLDSLVEQSSDVTVWGFRLIDRSESPAKTSAVPEGFGSLVDTNKDVSIVVDKREEAADAVQKEGEPGLVSEVIPQISQSFEGSEAREDVQGVLEDSGEDAISMVVREAATAVGEKVVEVKERVAETVVEELAPVVGEEMAEKVEKSGEQVVESVLYKVAEEAASVVEESIAEVVVEAAREVEKDAAAVGGVAEVVEEVSSKVESALSVAERIAEAVDKAAKEIPGVSEVEVKKVELVEHIVEETEVAVDSLTFVAKEVEEVAEGVRKEAESIELQASEVLESEEKRKEVFEEVVDLVMGTGEGERQQGVEIPATEPPPPPPSQVEVAEPGPDASSVESLKKVATKLVPAVPVAEQESPESESLFGKLDNFLSKSETKTQTGIDSATEEPQRPREMQTGSESVLSSAEVVNQETEITEPLKPEGTETVKPEETKAAETTELEASEASVSVEPKASVVAEPEISVITEPEASVATKPEAPLLIEPEISITTEPKVPVTTESVVSLTAEPVDTVTTESVVSIVTEPIVSVPTEPVVSVTTEPEASVATEPEAPLLIEPEISLTTESEVSVTTEPIISVATEPEVCVATVPEISVGTKKEESMATKPEVSAVTEPEVSTVIESEVSVATEPEASVVTEKEASITAEPEFSVTAEPESVELPHIEISEPGPDVTLEESLKEVATKSALTAPPSPLVEQQESPEWEGLFGKLLKFLSKPEKETQTGAEEVVNQETLSVKPLKSEGIEAVELEESKTAKTTDPEASAVTEKEASLAAEPEALVIIEPEASIYTEPEAPVIIEPEASVATEPEAPVATEPPHVEIAEPEPDATTGESLKESETESTPAASLSPVTEQQESPEWEGLFGKLAKFLSKPEKETQAGAESVLSSAEEVVNQETVTVKPLESEAIERIELEETKTAKTTELEASVATDKEASLAAEPEALVATEPSHVEIAEPGPDATAGESLKEAETELAPAAPLSPVTEQQESPEWEGLFGKLFNLLSKSEKETQTGSELSTAVPQKNKETQSGSERVLSSTEVVNQETETFEPLKPEDIETVEPEETKIAEITGPETSVATESEVPIATELSQAEIAVPEPDATTGESEKEAETESTPAAPLSPVTEQQESPEWEGLFGKLAKFLSKPEKETQAGAESVLSSAEEVVNQETVTVKPLESEAIERIELEETKTAKTTELEASVATDIEVSLAAEPEAPVATEPSHVEIAEPGPDATSGESLKEAETESAPAAPLSPVTEQQESPEWEGLFGKLGKFFSKPEKETQAVAENILPSAEVVSKETETVGSLKTDVIEIIEPEEAKTAEAVESEMSVPKSESMKGAEEPESTPDTLVEVLEPVVEEVAKEVVVGMGGSTLMKTAEVVKDVVEEVAEVASKVIEVTDVVEEVSSKVVTVMDAIQEVTEKVKENPGVSSTLAMKAEVAKQVSEGVELVAEAVTYVAEKVESVAEAVKEEATELESQAIQLIQSKKKRKQLVEDIVEILTEDEVTPESKDPESQVTAEGKTESEQIVSGDSQAETSAPDVESVPEPMEKEGLFDKLVKLLSKEEEKQGTGGDAVVEPSPEAVSGRVQEAAAPDTRAKLPDKVQETVIDPPAAEDKEALLDTQQDVLSQNKVEILTESASEAKATAQSEESSKQYPIVEEPTPAVHTQPSVKKKGLFGKIANILLKDEDRNEASVGGSPLVEVKEPQPSSSVKEQKGSAREVLQGAAAGSTQPSPAQDEITVTSAVQSSGEVSDDQVREAPAGEEEKGSISTAGKPVEATAAAPAETTAALHQLSTPQVQSSLVTGADLGETAVKVSGEVSVSTAAAVDTQEALQEAEPKAAANMEVSPSMEHFTLLSPEGTEDQVLARESSTEPPMTPLAVDKELTVQSLEETHPQSAQVSGSDLSITSEGDTLIVKASPNKLSMTEAEGEDSMKAGEARVSMQPSWFRTEASVTQEGKDVIVQLEPPSPEKDYGQSNPEDSDMYTTRG